ncbi:unnamed protein product (macronuclear) [Paramecium tetraurelia]|uniref:DNA 3'-5' helicase n=1 Tax=Paramecium tetraurelia TaxID=5888 RepID=A0DDY7_PARTE|nr:uncharacterized protein GSPATT00016096001 [Paramecium tetraurelia]CAK81254.1 unnamed protein product [Paramecium tetraurelia]|eukprot:XP_001448651.1 hypothetical protein (macronuclear) [Paramecium tetraurelia strain d4-2]
MSFEVKKRKLQTQPPEVQKLLIGDNMDYRNIEIVQSNKPLILSPDLGIIVEKFNPLYEIAFEFLMCVAEPISRSELIHEYVLTQMSMYTAMVLQYSADDIIRLLDLLSKNKVPQRMEQFIRHHTNNIGQAKFFLQDKSYYIDIGETVLNQIMMNLQDKNSLQEVIQEEQIIHNIQVNPQLKNFEQQIELKEADIEQMAKEIDTFKDWLAQDKIQTIKFKRFRIVGDYFDVAQALIRSSVPLIQEYDFTKEKQKLDINLKPSTKPRLYQLRAAKTVIMGDYAKSGLIVLPCGAGKTLVGVLCMSLIKSSTVIICDSNVSVEQWKREIEGYTTIDNRRIIRVTGFAKDKWQGEQPIVILTTYSWLIAQFRNNSSSTKTVWNQISEVSWGICIVDEVHRLPAVQFQNVLKQIKCAIKIGLTATLLREDQKLDNLYFMIGPKLYEENLIDLMTQGFLAKPHIIEIQCDMPPIFLQEYQTKNNMTVRQLLHTGNPGKYKALQFLIKNHEMLGHKIIVFCDSLLILNYYALLLGYPVIDGDLNTDEKNKIFSIFKNSNEIKTIFVSRVGDTGIDIPSASVGIEIGYLGGSRRQKVQRLGRVMRPKQNTNHEIQAFFYSLASKDTTESEYSYKRQKYITEQLGLNTELILEGDLPYNKNPQKYKYIKQMNEMDLLEQIMLSSNDLTNKVIDQIEEEVQVVTNTFSQEFGGVYKFQ